MPLLNSSASDGTQLLLALCVALVLVFEFVNGFHDTANAVATVIYTNALKPRLAVLLSGLCNFLGVFLGGIAVAMGIIKLLPVDLVVSAGVGHGLAMVFALLLSAVIWNLGTWYFGIPASSSHTLIGAILGLGIANSLMSGHGLTNGVNWSKAVDVGLALLISPVIGFSLAAVLLIITRRFMQNRGSHIDDRPLPNVPPPLGTRSLLIATCCGVSLAHGSNDGQKGVGLMMLVLMGLLPATYALDTAAPPQAIASTIEAATQLESTLTRDHDEATEPERRAALMRLGQVKELLADKTTVNDLHGPSRFQTRRAILLADQSIGTVLRVHNLSLTRAQHQELSLQRKALRRLTEYAPSWVLVAIALALGIGTTVGWKRVVVTVGEKIGKTQLTYSQGVCAQLVAASTIGMSAALGLPVSTTHVLSSGIAGTMVAQNSGLQTNTVRTIVLTWVFTLPATMFLSGLLYVLFCNTVG